MKRALLLSALAAAALGASATPAVAGLAGNPSFSHRIPVRVPAGATAAQLADDHGDATDHDSPAPTGSTRTATSTTVSGPGDDHGGASPRPSEPGDDRGDATDHDTGVPSGHDGDHGGHGDHGADD